jgi:Glycosyl transferases group 1
MTRGDRLLKQPGPKILEIGPVPFMWHAFPDTTVFYSTWYDETRRDETGAGEAVREPQCVRNVVSLASLPGIARRLADASIELIVVHAPPFSPWGVQALTRAFFRRSLVRGNLPVFRGLGAQLLRGPVAAPVAILDLDDPATIGRCNRFLLDKAVVYFKRELPIDYWLAFAGTLHRRVPTPRFRAAPRNRARIAKLRPISLGMPFEVARKLAASPPPPDVDKTIDVFFAGRIRNSATVRDSGFEELIAMRRDGCVIDVSEDTLPLDEYLARCARAHLVWSPAGFGWQCFRTYEAAACGAVALCGRSPVERHQPLIDGVHAIYYDVEPGELTRAVRSALGDRARLRAMGAAARQHALAFHTPTAIARHIFDAATNIAATSPRTSLA